MADWIPPLDPDPLELIGRNQARPWPGVARTEEKVAVAGVRHLGPGRVVRWLARHGRAPEGIRPREGDTTLVVEEPLLPEWSTPAVCEPLYLGLDRAVLWSARPVEDTGWELTVSDFRNGSRATRSVVLAAPTRQELDRLFATWGWLPEPPQRAAGEDPGAVTPTWAVATYRRADGGDRGC